MSNAGRSQRACWQKIDIQVDRDLFELNVFSLINLNRIAVSHFLEVGGGHVVVNSSLAGVLPVPFSASYTGAKHALHVTDDQIIFYEGTLIFSISLQ